jgi:hypothetical protein
MEKISLTRALVERKRLEDRIVKAIANSKFIDYKIGTEGKPMYDSESKANYQSVNDLIDRRNKIISKMAIANATEKVTIAGEEMTIAEAIARKNSIYLDEKLLYSLKNQYANIREEKEENAFSMESKFEELSKTMYGKEKVNDDEIKKAYEVFKKRNELIILDEIKIADEIKKLEKRIEDFNLNVDVALTEANGRITIEI